MRTLTIKLSPSRNSVTSHSSGGWARENIVLNCHTFDPSNGYGRLASSLIPFFNNVKLLADGGVPEHLVYLQAHGNPDISIAPPFVVNKAPIVFTMWESSKLPPIFTTLLNHRKLIITPCEQNKTAFVDSGVVTPVEVCNLDTRPKYYMPPAAQPFTFIHVGCDSSVPERKRSADIVNTFIKTFSAESDVRLIIKKSSTCKKIHCFDSRVRLITDTISEQTLRELYVKAHVGIFLGAQEGWGYPALDMMSVGRPVIAPFWGGFAEYLDNTCGYSLRFKLKPTPKAVYDSIGLCPYVEETTLSQSLRFVYENKEDTVAKGVMAYRRSMGFTQSRMYNRLTKILNAYPIL